MIDIPQVLDGVQLVWELRWSILVGGVLATFPWWTTRPLRSFTGNILELYNFRSVLVLGTVNLLATCAVVTSAWLSMALHGWVDSGAWCWCLGLLGIPTPFAAMALLPTRPKANRVLMRLTLILFTVAAPVAAAALATVIDSEVHALTQAHFPRATVRIAHLAMFGIGGVMLFATWLTAVVHAPFRVPQRSQVAAGAWLLSVVALAAAWLPGIMYWGGHLGWLEAGLGRAGIDATGLSTLEPPVDLLAALFAVVGLVVWTKRHSPTLAGEGAPPAKDWGEHAAALRARLNGRKVAILVTAQGGGIQSAAWTTRVLQGLQEQIPDFWDRVVLTSGTSGGAVGMAWAVASCTARPAGEGLARAASAARVGSLDAFAWGTVYLDGLGAAWERRRGRGWALEEDWRLIAREHDVPRVTLRGLRDAVSRGELPVPVLNGTVLESAGPFTLCPLAFPPVEDGTPLPSDWWEAQVGDIDWFSAARLASSFPYATPMVYVPRTKDPFHVTDGGYFDNSGTYSALRWMGGLRDELAQLERVVLVDIGPFGRPAEWKTGSRWYVELLAPIALLYRVLFREQRLDNEGQLGRLAMQTVSRLTINYERPPSPSPESWLDRAHLLVARWVLGYKGLVSEPLSWQLSEYQRAAIDRAWERWWAANGGEVMRVLS